MKWKIYIMLSACFWTFLLSGCDNFLEVEQKGQTTIPVFFSDVEGLNAGLVGSYNKVYAYYDNEFLKYPDAAGNMLRMNSVAAGTEMLDQYNYTSDAEQETGAVGYVWRRILEALANVNNVIQYQPSILSKYPNKSEECNRILGEALFLRALSHFDLCRTYAQPYNYTSDASHLGIPVLLKTPGPDDDISRASVKAVYTQILSDLDKAVVTFANIPQRGVYHASKQAVYALYSRVYLYMEDWVNAEKYAKLAIASTPLAEGTTFLNMYWTVSTPGETIFRLNGEDQSGKLKTFYDLSAAPADTLLTLFDEGDIRLKLLENASGNSYCSKYLFSSQSGTQVNRDDPMVFRVSEMYLNAAEACWHNAQYADARMYIKAILKRAIDESYANEIMAQYSDESLNTLIEKERIKELCFEGHNLFDITRKKQNLLRGKSTNSVVRQIAYPSDYFVLPIPQVELDANTNMQPNPTVNK
nr:RagB/SusD family nutrient uptake outer membrane protein [uncultured Bacteroides sp.]